MAFGAKGDNATDDSTAIMRAFAAAKEQKRSLYFPAGTYNVGSKQLRLTLNEVCFSGITIYGDGVGRSQINAQNVTTSPQVLIYSDISSGQFEHGFKDCHSIYLSFKDIGFLTNTPGVGLQIGADDFLDPINEPEIEASVFNASTSPTAEAVRLNHVLNGELKFSATTNGPGTALHLRRTVFSSISGSYTALGGVAVRIAGDFNYGNVLTAMDMAYADTCVVSSSQSAFANTFIGGNFSYKKFGVSATAGNKLLIINPLINPIAPATAADMVARDSQGNKQDVGLSFMP